MADLNKGFNMDAYNGFREKVRGKSEAADRDKTAVARWVQGEQALVTVGDVEVDIGADDGLNMMEMALASLAACDVAVVAMRASYMNLKIKAVTAEMSGHFNVASLLGIEGSPPASFERISAKITVDAPDASEEDIAALWHACETGSPVGSVFALNVPTDLEIVRK